jgi:hypothetical protein
MQMSKKEKSNSLIGENFDSNPQYGHQSVGFFLSQWVSKRRSLNYLVRLSRQAQQDVSLLVAQLNKKQEINNNETQSKLSK